jgi:hypothetical protein
VGHLSPVRDRPSARGQSMSGSSPSRMFMARPQPAGFGISRVLGSAAPRSTRRNRHRVSLRACQTESRRSKGQVSRVLLGTQCLAGWHD